MTFTARSVAARSPNVVVEAIIGGEPKVLKCLFKGHIASLKDSEGSLFPLRNISVTLDGGKKGLQLLGATGVGVSCALL